MRMLVARFAYAMATSPATATVAESVADPLQPASATPAAINAAAIRANRPRRFIAAS
jgi:hypothetical protein